MHLETGLWSRALAFSVFLCAAFANTSVAGDTDYSSKSVIYLITRNTGTFSSVLVSVNGKLVGTATPATHLMIVANPGTIEIGSAGSTRGTTLLVVAAGRHYYLAHNIGISGAPEFRMLTESEGQSELAQTRKLAEVGSVPTLGHERVSGVERRPEFKDKDSSRGFHQKNAIAIIVKGGAYKVSEEMQLTGTIPTLVEGKATSVGGLEVEWRHPKGFAIGGEIFYFRNSWADTIGFVGDVATLTYGVNGKYYFGIADIIYPYVGVGVGVAASDFSGSDGFSTYESSSTGIAYQGLVGVEFRYKYIGINLQYKRLTADVKAALYDGSTETNEMGGTGQLVGLTIHIPLR